MSGGGVACGKVGSGQELPRGEPPLGGAAGVVPLVEPRWNPRTQVVLEEGGCLTHLHVVSEGGATEADAVLVACGTRAPHAAMVVMPRLPLAVWHLTWPLVGPLLLGIVVFFSVLVVALASPVGCAEDMG